MIVTFCGHSSFVATKEAERKMLLYLSTISGDVDFYLGGYGDFDELCARVCRTIKDARPCCELAFVSPYLTQAQQTKIKYMLDHHLYDSSVYPPLENVPLRFAINKRNEWMINQADLVIAYVDHTFGGAYKTLQYAKRKKKRIINLAEQK